MLCAYPYCKQASYIDQYFGLQTKLIQYVATLAGVQMQRLFAPSRDQTATCLRLASSRSTMRLSLLPDSSWGIALINGSSHMPSADRAASDL